jgi:hypothetical protein
MWSVELEYQKNSPGELGCLCMMCEFLDTFYKVGKSSYRLCFRFKCSEVLIMSRTISYNYCCKRTFKDSYDPWKK